MEPKLPIQPQDEAESSANDVTVTSEEVVASEPPEEKSDIQSSEPVPIEVEPSTSSTVSETLSDITPEVPVTTSFSALPTTSKSPKKKRLVAAIIAAIAVVVIGGGGASAYFLWYQKPEKVVLDAALGYLNADHVQTTTVITSDSELLPGTPTNIKLKKMSFDTKAASKVNGEFSASLTIALNGRDYTTGAKAIIVESGDVYFQINGIKELLQKFIDDFADGATVLSDEAKANLAKLQDKWVKVTKSDLGDAGDAYQCYVDAYKKYENDKKVSKELLDAYKANPFVSVKDSVPAKNGNLGYNVTFDEDVARKFSKAVANTTVGKELSKCDSSSSSDEDSSVDVPSSSDDTKFTMTVWVSRWTHTLKAVDYSLSAGSESYKFTGRTDVSYDKSVDVKAPSESISLKQWLEDARSFYQEAYGGFYGDSSTPLDDTSDTLFDTSI